MILVDTNVLLRIAQPRHQMHGIAIDALSKLYANNQVLCVVPQVLFEYWVVATRGLEANGLQRSVAEATLDLHKITQRFQLCRDEPVLFDLWRTLVTQYLVSGKSAHDARLVAAMQLHNIDRILTFNVADFKRYSAITVISPSEIVTP